MAIFARCVGSSNEAGWPLLTKRSKTNRHDIIKRITILKKSALFSFIFMKINKNSVFYIITAVGIIILYLLLQPKILSKLFAIRNPSLLNAFITKTVETKKIDVQAFWKMREFYCPGSFTYDKAKNPFLKYSCQWLQSEDFLSTDSKLNIEKINKNNVLLQTDTVLIYKDTKKIRIEFLASSDDMKKAVGVFDYAEKDKELVKGKNWYDVAEINL